MAKFKQGDKVYITANSFHGGMGYIHTYSKGGNPEVTIYKGERRIGNFLFLESELEPWVEPKKEVQMTVHEATDLVTLNAIIEAAWEKMMAAEDANQKKAYSLAHVTLFNHRVELLEKFK